MSDKESVSVHDMSVEELAEKFEPDVCRVVEFLLLDIGSANYPVAVAAAKIFLMQSDAGLQMAPDTPAKTKNTALIEELVRRFEAARGQAYDGPALTTLSQGEA